MKSHDERVKIDLDEYRSEGGRVFVGRERGQRCRQKANLDWLDERETAVEIHVPEDTFSVNSSFFLAMFAKSIRKHGAARFRELYEFTGLGRGRHGERRNPGGAGEGAPF